MTAVVSRLAAATWGLAAVVVTAFHLPGPYSGWLIGLGVLSVGAACVRAWLGFLETFALVLVVAGAGVAAAYGRLSIPAATLIAVLAFGYLLATDLAGTLAGAASVRGVGLAAWVRALVPLLLGGLGGVVVIVVTLLVSVDGRAWMVLLAPIALFCAAFLAVGRRTAR